MNLATSRSQTGGFSKISGKIRPGLAFGLMIVGAMIAFEAFNYSTTDYALTDLLGDLKFLGIRWATILAIAFSGIDFAGIARIFTPEQGADEPKEVWYLFGAWLLAATMNAVLTWWGVSMAIANHAMASTSVVSANTLTKVVPVFVALMVWVIRILLIGSLSRAGDRIFSDVRAQRTRSSHASEQPGAAISQPAPVLGGMRPQTNRASFSRPVVSDMTSNEPTYHNLNGQRPMAQASYSDRSRQTTQKF